MGNTTSATTENKEKQQAQVITTLDESTIENLKLAFQEMDTDHDDMVSLEELVARNSHGDVKLSDEVMQQLTDIFNSMDLDHNNKVSLQEYISFVERQQDVDKQEQQVMDILRECQQHVVKSLDSLSEEARQASLSALVNFEANYPGGIRSYCQKAAKLLAASEAQENPFEGFSVCPPPARASVRFSEGGDDYLSFEAKGLTQLRHIGFVLVAGGLGERLGYPGIKVSLSVEKTTNTCYMKYYVQTILAFQRKAQVEAKDDSIKLKLAIMTSGDTDSLTRQLLDENNNFGLEPDQLVLLKQPLVPALKNAQADIALNDDGSVAMKPHGHGDVHLLLHSTGTAARWLQEGTRWLCFFQDTNALVFRSVLPALGVSADRNLAVNFITVPRQPGDAIGGVCQLEKDDTKMTINVEYNQMSSLLPGDEPTVKVTDQQTGEETETGVSVFPGNINCFIIEMQTYERVLRDSSGLVEEFINPKYVPNTNRTQFLKPTRVECMMQDFAKLLTQEDHKGGRIGLSQFPKWRSFSAVKNALTTGRQKQQNGLSCETAASGEADFYNYTRRVLAEAVQFTGPPRRELFAGIEVDLGARVVVTPRTACSLTDTLAIWHPSSSGAISLTSSSSLVLDAPGIVVEELKLDGAMEIHAVEGALVRVRLTLTNQGTALRATPGHPLALVGTGQEQENKSGAVSEDIWGYQLAVNEVAVFRFSSPGAYELTDESMQQHLVTVAPDSN